MSCFKNILSQLYERGYLCYYFPRMAHWIWELGLQSECPIPTIFFCESNVSERRLRLLSSTFSLSVVIYCRFSRFIPSGQLSTDCEYLEMVGYFSRKFEQDCILELCGQSLWLQPPWHKSLGICCIVNKYFQYGKFLHFSLKRDQRWINTYDFRSAFNISFK